MGSATRRLTHALFIVPQAHVRFDRRFQTEMYELFHVRPLARWGHLICTPIIVVALLAALAALGPIFPHGSVTTSGLVFADGALLVDGALLGALAIIAWSFYVDRIAAIVMIPLAIAAALGARELAAALGDHALIGSLAIAYAGGLLQAISHASEPIPPPWTGSHAFVPLGTFLRTAPPSRMLGLALLSPTVFTLLEVWASPRVWVLEVLHLMMRAGYRPELRTQLDARIDEMLADARTGWAQPELATPAPRAAAT